jgi:TRAP-type mannitol/chloroaromatic compound transport system substrate-binding protein
MKKLFIFFLVVSWIPAVFFSSSVGAQTTTFKWKVQSGAPAADFRFVNIKDLAEKLDQMSGGRLKIDTLGAGAVVPTFEILDAVHKGAIDGGHSYPGWWAGKNIAVTLYGGVAGGPYGLTMDDFMSWVYQGGGLELYHELLQKEMKYNVVSFPILTENADSLGWFRKPVKSVAEFKKLKYRTSGMSAELFKEMGVSVVILPVGDIVPSLERGVIDGAELSGPANDIAMGFHTVRKTYIMRSVQQPTGFMEFLINKTKWDELPPDLKAIVRWGCMAETLGGGLKQYRQNQLALQEFVNKHGVTVAELPKEINIEMLKAWDRIAERKSKENPSFAKILASLKDWASLVVPYRAVALPPLDVAGEYYWKGVNPYKKK